MSALLLQINLDLQAGAVINTINSIESSIDKMIGKLQQFSQFFASNPINIVSSQQLDIVSNLAGAVKQVDAMGMSINNRNVEEISRRKELLDMYIEQAQAMGLTVDNCLGLNDALNKQLKLDNQLNDLYVDANKFQKEEKKFIESVLKNKTKGLTVTKSTKKEFDNYVSALETAVKLGGVHLQALGKTKDEAKELLKNMQNVKFVQAEQVDYINMAAKGFNTLLALIPTSAVLIATLTDPLRMVKDSLGEIHEAWKKNNQVSNNFLVDADDKAAGLGVTLVKTRNKISSAGGGMADEFHKLGIQLGDNIVTLEQSSQALDAVMASQYKSVAKTNDELAMYSSIIAQSSRATGLSIGATAELMLRAGELGTAASKAATAIERQNDGVKASARLNAVLVNATAKYGMSIDEVNHVTSILDKNMGLLKTSFKGNNELLKAGIPVTSQYATALTSLGKAAKDAGYNSKMAMDTFASAMEAPMENVMLLGNAVTSTDPTEQMRAMGETAVQVADMMKGKSLMEQQIIAGIYGKTVDQINAAAAAHKGLTEKYGDLSNQDNLLKMNQEMADQAAADETMKQAQTDAANNLAAASDKLTIIFSRLATALQPIINGLAWLISLPVVPWVIAVGGALAALFAAMKGWKLITSLTSGIEKLGTATDKIQVTKGGGAGGGMKGFADGVKGFVNTLGEIKIVNALKAALGIAAIGAALAVGVYALNKASTGMTFEQAVALTLTVGGIVGMSYLLSKMGSIGPQALMGAVMVGAVGAALALGVFLLNKASNGMSLEQAGVLGIIVGGLLVTMGILALMGPIGAPALLGAVFVGLVGAALAGGIALIALASKLIDPDIGEKFEALSTGIGWLALTAVTGPLALIGAVAMAAAAPLLALSMLTIGAASAAAGESTIQTITGLAQAASMIPPGAGMAMIGLAGGLTAIAAALAGGAIFSFFSGGMVNNAKEMGAAMQVLLGPIAQLGGIGDQVGKSFVAIADGLKVFVEAINDSSGWFSSFEGKAEKVAAAMRKIAGPMNEMGGPADAKSEEVKKSLALTIESTNKSNKEIVEELKAIKTLLANNTDKALADKIDKSTDVLKKIYAEMITGSGFGATSANADYT